MKWFSSDQHFHHANVITYCGRPFTDIQNMAEVMILKWNEKVKAEDEVYVLGDFCFGGTEKWKAIVPRLNGRKFLVRGNHDPKQVKAERAAEFGFEWIGADAVLKDPDLGDVMLSHYPYKNAGDHTEEERYADRRPEDNGGYLFHGHVHCLWKIKDRMVNVGVDQWDFYPVSLDEIKAEIEKTPRR